MLRSSELIIRFVKLGCEGQQACAPSQKFDQVVHGSALELSGRKSVGRAPDLVFPQADGAVRCRSAPTAEGRTSSS